MLTALFDQKLIVLKDLHLESILPSVLCRELLLNKLRVDSVLSLAQIQLQVSIKLGELREILFQLYNDEESNVLANGTSTITIIHHHPSCSSL